MVYWWWVIVMVYRVQLYNPMYSSKLGRWNPCNETSPGFITFYKQELERIGWFCTLNCIVLSYNTGSLSPNFYSLSFFDTSLLLTSPAENKWNLFWDLSRPAVSQWSRIWPPLGPGVEAVKAGDCLEQCSVVTWNVCWRSSRTRKVRCWLDIEPSSAVIT